MNDTASCLARKTEYELNLFKEVPSKQMIVNKERIGERTAYITFMAPYAKIDSIWIKGVPHDKLITQFNIKQGTGGGFGMRMVPRTGVFEMTRGTSKAPAYTVLKDMGVTDDQMKAAWGDALYSINRDAGMSTRARQQADRFYN